ncbi:MBL fold metallo-hydrolase [Pseudomonas matsuisoli]|uniref:MBL fold hydrolase n=1 Tax=Pseudomonas matsuisoli TaxID=1515666 RepID=A0A917Q3C8_9PSED|nr:MBL fold metallo-hydrolase [Pseudomonas matsuisoli]GGK09315.1 MBL fold hydrolase [Pseudomonas matsuisoli]
MPLPRITHHGAKDSVTGSCHQLWMDDHNSLLIDCGMFQGQDARLDDEDLALEFPIDGIKALVVTHVHIDHVGRIPHLLAAGFTGPILCSEPSARLLPIVLEDAFKLGFTRDPKQLDRYLQMVEKRIIALPYDTWFTLLDTGTQSCRIRLQPAGHVLGSAYVELDVDNAEGNASRVVFSGDLGAPHSPILPDLVPPEHADLLVLESTYGDRRHEHRQDRNAQLKAVIERALADEGSVLIPAFSIGRTQELLYELEDILHDALDDEQPQRPQDGDSNDAAGSEVDWPRLPVILDSPLASRFTKTYRELQQFWDDEARERLADGRKPLAFKQLVTIDNHQDHLRVVDYLTKTARPAIVIAGNGMCSGGRIVNYLKAMLGDHRHHVVFVGYQGQGTPGRAIQHFGPKGGYVDLDGERFDIRAKVDSLGGYSAHADQQDLINFVTRMKTWPRQIRLVHGESRAKQALASRLRECYEEEGIKVDLQENL